MDTFLTPEQLAVRLGGRSVSTLAKWRLRGYGPVFRKLGARVVYALADVEAWLAEQPVQRSTADGAQETRRPRAGRPPADEKQAIEPAV